MQEDRRFRAALRAMEAESGLDPRSRLVQGRTEPRELLEARRVEAWLLALAPDAGELLRLAARAHHLGRWRTPRASYPTGRLGYLRWREAAKRRHAAAASRALTGAGYDEAAAARVAEIVSRRGLGYDPEAQLLEDAVCLTFLELGLAEFAAEHGAERTVEVLAKTLRKMSPEARRVAGTLALEPALRELVEAAAKRPRRAALRALAEGPA